MIESVFQKRHRFLYQLEADAFIDFNVFDTGIRGKNGFELAAG